MRSGEKYDVAFIGHYTKDTIVSSAGTRVVDGGACNYGSNVAARMGLRVAVVTRLAAEDRRVTGGLSELGIDVFIRETPHSTCLRLEYPTSNVDERVIRITSTAGPFNVEEVKDIDAKVFQIGASMRGEVPIEVVRSLRRKEAVLSADVQSFIRTNQDGLLNYEPWPERDEVLGLLDVLKTDAVEAGMLTGRTDIREAARIIAGLGPKEVVLTHRDGVLVLAEGGFHEASFLPEKIVGRSGRGDTCIASYVSKRLTSSPEEATVFAAAVTSMKMEAEGPFRRDMREVEDLIRRKYRGRVS